MKLPSSPKINTRDESLIQVLRDISRAVNMLAEGRLAALYNAVPDVTYNGNANGDYIRNSDQRRGQYQGWACIGTTWYGVGQIGALKNTTANRPTKNTLGVPTNNGFSGYLYFDTTLDADGKPIWWSGTAWVDATGAVV